VNDGTLKIRGAEVLGSLNDIGRNTFELRIDDRIANGVKIYMSVRATLN